LNTKKVVITGGPGTGKTSLIESLQNRSIVCMPEISRAVTQKAQKDGIDQLFLHDPLLFSRMLLEGRLDQFREPKLEEGQPHLFYDRGLPDVTAYLRYLKTPYPTQFDQTCRDHRYDVVFLLPPWEAIYQQDNERYESFDQALLIFEYLLSTYQDYGYKVQQVPPASLEERIDYMLNHLNQLG